MAEPGRQLTLSQQFTTESRLQLRAIGLGIGEAEVPAVAAATTLAMGIGGCVARLALETNVMDAVVGATSPPLLAIGSAGIATTGAARSRGRDPEYRSKPVSTTVCLANMTLLGVASGALQRVTEMPGWSQTATQYGWKVFGVATIVSGVVAAADRLLD